MMDHLKMIRVNISQLTLGFDENWSKVINWKTYTDSWKMVDSGITDPTKMPLYQPLTQYYSILSKDRLRFEQELTNFSDPPAIAREWIRRHIELYLNIRKQGFIPKARKKPIRVRILEDGTLWLLDGNNTISILKHLNYKYPIDVVVDARDREWIELKEKMHGLYGKKLTYQPAEHPDFGDWEVDRQCSDRWNLIKPYLGDISGKEVVDIGCNLGWFCRRLAESGAKVVGLEPEVPVWKMSRRISNFNGFTEDNPLLLPTRFEDYFKNHEADVTLMLSVVHHYFRKNEMEGWKALKLISEKSEKLILELGTNNLPFEWSPELVSKHTQYAKFDTIQERERPIYLFSR